MRQWLVKNFVGIYRMKIFGKYTSAVRASRIIAPIMILFGILLIILDRNLFSVVTTILGCSVLFWFGFFHFEFFPVKWDELDDEQKWDFGMFLNSGDSTKKIKFTEKQRKEWIKLNEFFTKKYSK